MEAMSVFSKVSQFRLEDRKQQAEEAIEDVAANATPPEEIVREVVEETIENEEPVKEATENSAENVEYVAAEDAIIVQESVAEEASTKEVVDSEAACDSNLSTAAEAITDFTCDLCEREFNNFRALRTHQSRTHKGGSPIPQLDGQSENMGKSVTNLLWRISNIP